MADLGGDTVPMPAPQFTRFIADETAKWAKVVKFSGAKVNGAPQWRIKIVTGEGML
jgi:hypothetical protein